MRHGNAAKALFILGVAVALAIPAAVAQQRPGPGMPKYDPATEVTVKGTVTEVREDTSPMGWPGTHLTLKTEKETWDVHVGPSSFLAGKNVSFAKGDEVEVTGSKIKYEGAGALLAREVKKGDKTLILRNAQGIPQWSRSRWRY
ncbi:MAG TPA: DNA-binding protein [Candidatus Xenobia bacterium]|nr:DNA-binding protein [Candidatus Xenobia bacterium]